MTTKNATYEYGKGNTFIRKDGTVGTVTKLPPNTPEPGDILFYKKRDWKKRRLNEMNQWKFVCVETQGQERGKWKVQGLHKEVGDFNWFEPHYLMRSSEVTNDLVTKTQYPVKEDTKVKQNNEKKPISVDRPEGENRKKIREMYFEQKMMQKDIASKLGITSSAVSMHIKKMRRDDQKKMNAPRRIGEYPIFNFKETADYLGIGLKELNGLVRDHSIDPVVHANVYKFTESQIETISKIIKQKEKDVTPEELGNYGANYQSAEQLDRTEHKATTEMKNYNYKRVISENLRMIKSLVHQTNELLEKIQ